MRVEKLGVPFPSSDGPPSSMVPTPFHALHFPPLVILDRSQTEPGSNGLGDDMAGGVAKVRAIDWQAPKGRETNQERGKISDAGIGIWWPSLVCIENPKGQGSRVKGQD